MRKIITINVESETEENEILFGFLEFVKNNFFNLKDLKISVTGKDKTVYYPDKKNENRNIK